MIARRLTMILAAAGMTLAPIAGASASPNAASSLSLARAGASLGLASYFQDDDDDDDNGSTAVILGVVLIVLLGAAAISGNGGGGTANSP